MTTKTNTDKVFELRFDSEGRVVVVPEDNNIMAISVKEAVEACRAYSAAIDFNFQFTSLLEKLNLWTAKNSDLVCHSFLTTRDTGLLFLVIQNEPAFNRKLEELLTDLDVEIASEDAFSLIRMSVLAIPDKTDAIRDSFSPKHAIRISNGK